MLVYIGAAWNRKTRWGFDTRDEVGNVSATLHAVGWESDWAFIDSFNGFVADSGREATGAIGLRPRFMRLRCCRHVFLALGDGAR